MLFASALDSKVVHSAERFRGKHEYFSDRGQNVSGVGVIAISRPPP
jgi:hypothetical protein